MPGFKFCVSSLLCILLVACGSSGGSGNGSGGTLDINAGSNQTVDSGQVVTLSGSIPSGISPNFIRWVQISGSENVVIDESTSLTTSFEAPWLDPADNDLSFRLTVIDDEEQVGFDEMVVKVNNSGPLADPGLDLVVLGGTTVDLDGSESRATNGGSISDFLWRSVGGSSVSLSSTISANPSFTAPVVDDREVLTFELTVTDSTTSDTETVTVTVVDELTFSDFGGQFYGIDIDVAQQIAFVAQGEGGLGIYDISTPADPVLIGTYNTSGNAQDVKAKDNLAYIADQHAGLVIVDVSIPASPFLIGGVDTNGRATAVALSGDFAYLADYNDGFKAIDISDPANPQITDEKEDGASNRILGVTLSADGMTAYVTDRTTILVYDLSNPAIPVLKFGGGVTVDREANAIALSTDEMTAYVANGENGMLVFDITDKNSLPVLLKTITTNDYVRKVTVDGGTLLLADGEGGVSLFNISDTEDPTILSTLDTVGDAEDVAILSSNAVVADGEGGLIIISFSDPVDPIEIASIVTVGKGYGISVQGTYAYIADFLNGLVVVDITNPLSPKFAAHFPIEGGVRDVKVVGDYAYVANDDKGMRVIDISNINGLSEVALVQLGSNPRQAFALTIDNGFAYVAAHYGGLYVVDITSPENPVVRGSNHFGVGQQSASQAKGVAVEGNIAFVANGSESFALSDVTNPDDPKNTAVMLSDEFDNSNTKGDGHDIDVKNGYAYMAHNGAGLAIIDISNPLNPTIFKEFQSKDIGFTSRQVNSVLIEGNHLFANNGNVDTPERGGDDYLAIWDISNPAGLVATPDAFFQLGGKFPGMDISGNYIYMAGEGLKVIDITDRSNPHQ